MKRNGKIEWKNRPEHDLLICSVQPTANTELSERTRSILRQPLDWKYLINLANEHRVIPSFYNRLKDFPELVPAEPISDLRSRFRKIADTNLALTGKLLKLLALLGEHDISAIPYKGPILAQTAYGDIRLRQFIDLDILVHKRDMYKVKDLFLANGCQPGWHLTAAQETAVLRHYYEYPFLCNDGRVLVEVHWEFAEPFFSFAFEIEQLWNRVETVSIQGKQMLTLSAEDSFLVLCAHGSKHLWKRLGWICDVAQLVSRQHDLDWTVIFERAADLGLVRILWLGLLLASNLLGVALPLELSQKVQPESGVKTMAAKIGNGLFLRNSEPSGNLQLGLLQLRMRERMRDKFNYCFRLIVSTKLVDSLFMPMGRPR